MFLNVKLQRLCKSHCLQCITIIKSFRITGEISVHKGQGRRPLLDVRGLRALRQHCITHRHDFVIDIIKWAQEYFQKPLSVNTIRRAICRCHLKLYHAKRKPYVNMIQKRHRVLWAKAHLKWTVSKWKSVLWSDESKFDILVGNHGRRVLRAKEEGDLPACHQRKNTSKTTTNSSAAGNLYQARMGPNSNTKLQKLITSMLRCLQTVRPNYFETCSRHQIWNELILWIKFKKI